MAHHSQNLNVIFLEGHTLKTRNIIDQLKLEYGYVDEKTIQYKHPINGEVYITIVWYGSPNGDPEHF